MSMARCKYSKEIATQMQQRKGQGTPLTHSHSPHRHTAYDTLQTSPALSSSSPKHTNSLKNNRSKNQINATHFTSSTHLLLITPRKPIQYLPRQRPPLLPPSPAPIPTFIRPLPIQPNLGNPHSARRRRRPRLPFQPSPHPLKPLCIPPRPPHHRPQPGPPPPAANSSRTVAIHAIRRTSLWCPPVLPRRRIDRRVSIDPAGNPPRGRTAG